MQKKYISYDLFKLMILLVLLVILAVLLYARSPYFQQEEQEEQNSQNTGLPVEPGDVRASMRLPVFPDAALGLVPNTEQNGLINQDGDLVYILSDDEKTWNPYVPADIKNKLPQGFMQTQDESGVWNLNLPEGDTMYLFDLNELIWKPVEKNVIPELANQLSPDNKLACPGANPSRIQNTDEFVQVISAEIPLRSSPRADLRNYLIQLPKGTVLEIVGKPTCSAYLNGANLWWLVRTPYGLEGYAAEGSALTDLYYLEVIK